MRSKSKKSSPTVRYDDQVGAVVTSASTETMVRRAREHKRMHVMAHWTSRFLAGVLILGGHAWFLWYMEQDYRTMGDLSGEIYDYVRPWILVFLIAMLVEFCYCKYYGVGQYESADTLASLLLGTMLRVSQQVAGPLLTSLPYAYVWKHYAIYRFPDGAASWYFMFVAVEFIYYWVHRTGHTMHVFWAMHGIHHSSEEYNLSTALRQSLFHWMVSWVYYLPLAFFFPPALYKFHSQYNLLYQFWIHTCVIGDLGPFEWVLNTPSQHKVHHGRNEYCIDKNYGGTLCVFDRLFGTFQREKADVPVVFGLTHSVNRFEPFAVNVSIFRNIFANAWATPGVWNKFCCFYYGPGWVPGGREDEHYPIPPISIATAQPYEVRFPPGLTIYVLLQFFTVLALSSLQLDVMLELDDVLSTLCFTLFALYSLMSVGLVCERRRSARWTELVRSLLAPVSLVWTLAASGVPPTMDAMVEHPLVAVAALATLYNLAVLLLWGGVYFHVDASLTKNPDVILGFDAEDAHLAQALELELDSKNSSSHSDSSNSKLKHH